MLNFPNVTNKQFVISHARSKLELKLSFFNLTKLYIVPPLSSNVRALALLLNDLLKKTTITYFYLHFTNFEFRAKVCQFSLHTRVYRLHMKSQPNSDCESIIGFPKATTCGSKIYVQQISCSQVDVISFFKLHIQKLLREQYTKYSNQAKAFRGCQSQKEKKITNIFVLHFSLSKPFPGFSGEFCNHLVMSISKTIVTQPRSCAVLQNQDCHKLINV